MNTNKDLLEAEIARLENIIAIQQKQIERLMEARDAEKLRGLRYALDTVKGRRILNRPPAYLAALDEIEIFLNAAIERVQMGEPMHSTAEVQARVETELK